MPTLQKLFKKALHAELRKDIPSKKKKMDFIGLDLDIPHKLTRKDYYEDCY